jgi:hypothetical protein
MKKAAAAFIVLLGWALVIVAQSSSQWIKYNSSAGRYNVSLPGEPRTSQQETTVTSGEKVPQYLAVSPDGNGAFMVAYFDYTPEMSFSFEKARDGMLSAMQGTLLEEETVSFGNWPGRALKLVAKTSESQEFLVRVRYYDVQRRVYVLQCIFPRQKIARRRLINARSSLTRSRPIQVRTGLALGQLNLKIMPRLRSC